MLPGLERVLTNWLGVELSVKSRVSSVMVAFEGESRRFRISVPERGSDMARMRPKKTPLGF